VVKNQKGRQFDKEPRGGGACSRKKGSNVRNRDRGVGEEQRRGVKREKS